MTEPLLRIVQTALADRYVTSQELARGGMATVFLAEDLRRKQKVALKVLDPELSQSVAGERFLREMKVAGGLKHPNIVELLDSGTTAGLLYYVMPWFAGGTLRDRLLREGQLPLKDALRVTKDVAGALEFAHSQGVVHRDVKPGNILLDGDRALITDFGVARALDVAGGAKLTQSGLAVGTPQYMSPEQAAGDRNTDARADVYSLGCVLYEMLAGQPPFTAPTARSLIARHAMDAPPPLRTVRPDLSPEIEEVVLRAMAKAPADRFQSVAEMSQALSDPTILKRGRRPVVRTRTQKLAVAGIVAAVAAFGAVLYAAGTKATDGPAERAALVVASPTHGAGDSSVAEALQHSMEQAVVASGLGVQTPDGVRGGLRAMMLPLTTRLVDSVATEVAFRTGSAGAVISSVSRVGTGYALSASVRQADGMVRAAESVIAASGDGLAAAIDSLSRLLRARLVETRSLWKNAPSRTSYVTSSNEALRYYLRAVEVWEEGKPLDALPLMRSAIERDAGFAMAYLQLAELSEMLALDDIGPMERALQFASRLPPELRMVVQVGGEATVTRDFVREDEISQQLLQLPPPQPGYTRNYGYGGGMVAAIQLGDPRRALALWSQFRQELGDSVPTMDDWMLVPRGVAAAMANDEAEMQRILAKLRDQTASGGSQPGLWEAYIHTAAEDWPAAATAATKVTTSGGQTVIRARAWALLGWMEAVRGRPKAAYAAFDSALRHATALERPELIAAMTMERAEAAFALGDPEIALPLARQLAASDPRGSAVLRRYRVRNAALIHAICATYPTLPAERCRIQVPVDSARDALEALALAGWRAVHERRYQDAMRLRDHPRLLRGGMLARFARLSGAVASERAGDTAAARATYQALTSQLMAVELLTSAALMNRSYALGRLAVLGGASGDSARARLQNDWRDAEPGFLPARQLARQ